MECINMIIDAVVMFCIISTTLNVQAIRKHLEGMNDG